MKNNITKMSFLTISLLFCLTKEAYALQKAVVTSPRAIVYADTSLTTAIGYVGTGRELTVGENKKNFGTILPIIVSGRVAYIQVKDVALREVGEDEIRTHRYMREHEIENTLDKDPLRSLKENNYLMLSYNVLPLGGEWDDLAEASGNSTGGSASGIAVHVEHRPPDLKYSFGVGFGYYSATSDELKMRMLTIEGNFYYSPIKFGIISVELLGGLTFSGDTRVQTAADLPEARGNMFGTQIGIQARLLPKSRFGAVAGVSMRNLKFLNLDDIETYQFPNNPLIVNTVNKELGKVSTTTAYVGVSYKF